MEAVIPFSKPLATRMTTSYFFPLLGSILLMSMLQTYSAEKVRLQVSGASQGFYIECRSGNSLYAMGPIPDGTRSLVVGRAVAVIAEAASGETQILLGIVEDVEGQMGFAVPLELTSPILASLAADQWIRIFRQSRDIMIPNQGSGAALRQTIRSCRAPVAGPSPTKVEYRTVKEELKLEGDNRWIVLAAREEPEQAFAVAQDYRPKFRGRVKVVQASNGRYVIIAGPERVKSPAEYKDDLTKTGRAPADMYFSRGERFVGRVEKRE
jgi:hypothetical protein